MNTDNDDAPFLGVGGSGIVASECQLLNARGILVSNDFPSFIGRDVDVLVAKLGLGRGRIDGFGKALALGKASRLREVVDGLSLLVPGMGSAGRAWYLPEKERTHSVQALPVT